jgi:SNF2 family DNA or RNA helicase
MSKSENKTWFTNDGVLSFERGQIRIIPSADEIYSSVFENRYSDNINEQDVEILNRTLSFSRYPAELNIILQSTEIKDFPIELSIAAFNENGDSNPISWGNKADHIIIENTWYPFTQGIREDILAIMKMVELSEPGGIRLGQYLSLLKSDSELIKNQVLSVNSYFSDDDASNSFNVKADLYPYQKKGLQWLRFLKQEKIGGILADEMGLGKTLQIIALLSSDEKQDIFPSLIVSPTTLLENWRREFSRFTPHISTHIHQGSQRTGFPNELKKYNIVITSYDTVIRDSSLFNQIDWKLVVCDEAQAIKNPATKRATTIKRIPRETGIAVTGTPIENNLTDLWSIMDFSVPGFLGTQSDFEKTFEHSTDGAARLENLISPLILRRKITEVAQDLPAKIIIPQVLELNNYEAEQYENLRESTLKEFNSNASLVVLTKLRIFCAHPFLIEDMPDQDPAVYSNKYARLIEIAEEIVENGAKMIVFTSYRKMIDIIVADFAKRFNVYTASIDGRTPTEDRQKIVDTFSEMNGAAVLVLNPAAAGTGLNITAANHVIHYNLEWNPAKEDQASARAYRRGQDRPVTIHRLFYANTVEEAIDERLNRKRLLSGTAIVGVKGDEDDYEDILSALNKSPKDKR